MIENKQLDKDFRLNLHKAAILSNRVGDSIFRYEAGINVTQYLLISTIHSYGAKVSQRQLAEKLSITKGAISRQVSIGIQQGLIEFTTDPTSLRDHEVIVTPKGYEAMLKIEKTMSVFVKERREYISDDEFSGAIKTLEKLCNLLETIERQSHD